MTIEKNGNTAELDQLKYSGCVSSTVIYTEKHSCKKKTARLNRKKTATQKELNMKNL